MSHPVLNSLPKGWRYIEGATTAPKGYKWANNSKSLFSSDYRSALVKIF